MAKDKTTIRFWLRTDRPNKDGTAPIHLVYQIQGQRKYYGIPEIRLLSYNWHAKDQKAVFASKKTIKDKLAKDQYELLLTTNQVIEVNNKLSKIETDINDIETRFRLDQITYSPEMVIDRLKEMKQPGTKKDLLGTSITAFIKRFEEESRGTHKSGTIKVYFGLWSHIENFEKKKKTRLTFENIDVPTLRSFYGFLTESISRDPKQVKRLTK